VNANTLPQLHIQPPAGWLNDPNGIVHRHDGWHVFHQANPRSPVHGDIHWGHVSSPDLVTWTQHPIAFGPTPGGPDSGGCWSGVYLPWLSRPAVAYSGVVSGQPSSTVCVREALDDSLDQWTSPRVVASTPFGVKVMRDPFCFTWGHRQLAVLGAQLTSGEAAVLLYDVADAHDWRYLGVLLHSGELDVKVPLAQIWECPQLVIDGERCWLLVSRWVAGETLDVVAMSGRVTDDDGLPRLRITDVECVDAGDAFYAPQVALDPGHAPLLFGWVREPDETAAAASGISGCLTLPRRVDTSSGRLRFVVDDGLQRYADTAPAMSRELAAGRHTELPAQARVRGRADVLRVIGRARDVRIGCPAGEFELWTDGEVVEVFPAGAPPLTLRDSDTGSWRLSSPESVELTVWQVAPPQTLDAPPATAAAPVPTTA